MIEGILYLFLIAAGIGAAIVWIKSLLECETDLKCDPDDCDNCPFPCERQEGDNDEWTK